jgi:hypothetical protein
MTTPNQPKAVPTDLELMAYFDGELDTERALEVERYLEASEPARQKLDGLHVLGTWVRAHYAELQPSGGELRASGFDAVDASLCEGFTEALMARLESESDGGGELGSASRGADDPSRAEVPSPPRAVTPTPAAEERRASPRRGPALLDSPPSAAPANDNTRLLWGLVAAAAAAAAGLFFWGKGVAGIDESQIARAIGAPGASGSLEPVAIAPSSTAAPAERDDDSTGMEIAAVDFGAATGAIYYVPKGDGLVGAATTTVVWLADE